MAAASTVQEKSKNLRHYQNTLEPQQKTSRNETPKPSLTDPDQLLTFLHLHRSERVTQEKPYTAKNKQKIKKKKNARLTEGKMIIFFIQQKCSTDADPSSSLDGENEA
jgi:hypothetical protein